MIGQSEARGRSSTLAVTEALRQWAAGLCLISGSNMLFVTNFHRCYVTADGLAP